MKKVLITGARGFIGRNLAVHLATREGLQLFHYDVVDSETDLESWLAQADIVFHLAGVNRPVNVEEYETGNAGFTERICDLLRRLERTPKIVMSSSRQAELDNPYGASKRRSEEALQAFSRETGAPVSIYRLKNVFGKWCRPNYNSVVATFCYNIAHDLAITISEPGREIELVYVDDVVERLVEELGDAAGPASGFAPDTIPSTRITLGDLAGRIQAYHEMRSSLLVPDFSLPFNRYLFATYLSYVEPDGREYALRIKSDQRGNLAEFIKSRQFGQIFLSRTHPGVTRGNHYHHTKAEKFFVIAGEGVIRMRQIHRNDVVEYRVKGEDYRVVDIPPGHTHNITNVGSGEMITLFWASEPFDPDRPDTYFLDVNAPAQSV
jgi:UDP-2-acetamido-2,6-beta-L-arabino-hexul-4-ose reductase